MVVTSQVPGNPAAVTASSEVSLLSYGSLLLSYAGGNTGRNMHCPKGQLTLCCIYQKPILLNYPDLYFRHSLQKLHSYCLTNIQP